MTVSEFKSWADFTASSRNRWKSDPIAESRGEWLFFTGGENGRYIMIDKAGRLTCGSYTGAFPHIGEALFGTMFQKDFPTTELALQRVIETGGRAFLMDFIGARS